MTEEAVKEILTSRYRLHGRGNGYLDCYGAVILAARADGYDLQDVSGYTGSDKELSALYVPTLNIEPIPAPRQGAIIEMTYGEELHVGYCMDERTFIHMTRNGGKINHIGALPIRGVYGINSRL